MRLLLVEDEIDIQSFLRTSLEETGYEVEAAADGKTAERLAVDGVFDILIVDLGLPDQDGISLILKLRQLGVRAPVLILSARRSVDDRVRGLEQGGDDYLTKPFALAELVARLRNLLKRNSPAAVSYTHLLLEYFLIARAWAEFIRPTSYLHNTTRSSQKRRWVATASVWQVSETRS